MSYHTPSAEELALAKSLPVRPWTPSEPKTVPAGHASRAAVRSASKRAKRQTKHQRKGR